MAETDILRCRHMRGSLSAVDDRDVQVIMESLFDAHGKLDRILGYLEEDDEAEEDEADPS